MVAIVLGRLRVLSRERYKYEIRRMMEIFFSFGFGLLVKVYGYIKSNAIRPFSRFSHKSQAFFAFVSHTLVTTENREHNEDKAHSTYVGTYVHNNRDWMRNLKDTIVLQVQMRVIFFQ